jgi:hypothetical protein
VLSLGIYEKLGELDEVAYICNPHNVVSRVEKTVVYSHPRQLGRPPSQQISQAWWYVSVIPGRGIMVQGQRQANVIPYLKNN